MALTDQVAFVTGGNTGQGKAIAIALARQGADVVVADLEETVGVEDFDTPGLTTVQAIEKEGRRGLFLKLDVGDEDAFTAAVETTVAELGRLDIMVNNAGVIRAGAKLHNFTAADMDFCYRVNTRGAWNGTMAAIRHYLDNEKPGQVLNIVSTAGIVAYSNEGPYSMTKAATAMLVRNAAMEYAPYGIRVNGICPTFVRTSMSKAVAALPEFKEFIPTFIPMGRMAEVTDIANAAVFLTAPESNFLTGLLLPVDGGESMSKPAPPDLVV
jgi:NAD(P)-dependent dehydrogenase (short-subunit alcohol dehydrogenase family)